MPLARGTTAERGWAHVSRNRVLAAVLAVLVLASSVLAPAIATTAAPEDGGGTVSGEIDIDMAAATNGSTASYELANASQASDLNVTLTGVKSTEQESVSATHLVDGDSLDVPVAGTKAPENEVVTFTGHEQSRNTLWTGSDVTTGDSREVNVIGNLPPTNSTVTFTGRSQGDWINKTGSGFSDTASTSVSIDGAGSTSSSSPNPTVSVTGVENTETKTESGSTETGSSVAVDAVGSEPPTDAALTLNQSVFKTEWAATSSDGFHLQEGDSATRTIDVSGRDTVDEAIINVRLRWGGYADLSLTVDGVGLGTKTWDDGRDTKTFSGGSVDVSDKSSVDVTVTVTDANADGYTEQLDFTESFKSHITFPAEPVSGVDVTTETGETVTFDSEGTKSIPLVKGSNTLDISGTESGVPMDWTLSYTAYTVTTDAGVELNGQSKTLSQSLGDGETGSVTFDNAALQQGENTISLSLPEMSSDAPPMEAAGYGVSVKDVNATVNPAIDIGSDGSVDAQYDGVLLDGETAEVPLSGLETGSQTLAFASDEVSFDYELSTTENAQTEDPSVDVDDDGQPEASVSGTLSGGEMATREVSLSQGSNQVDLSTNSWAGAGLKVDWTEVTESKNPSVHINGHEVAYDGTLADGETATLDASTDWLQDGENTVTVEVSEDLPAGAPRARVGVIYQHTATTTHSTTYNATAWMEERTINKTFVDDQQDAELRLFFQPSVVTIQQLQLATNDGSLERVDSSQYNYSNGVVTLQLGDVEANTSVEVYAKGRRIKVHDGEISVLEPTLPGKALDTKFTITDRGEEFAIQANTQRVLHTTGESWYTTDEYARVTADGSQYLRLPGASEGSTARASYSPLVAMPTAGDVEVSIEDVSNRQFAVDPGQTAGDTVEYRWLNVIEGADYGLYSLTHRNTYDVAAAKDRGVTITDDDSPETLQFVSQNESGPGPLGTGETLRSGLVLLFAGGALVGTYLVQRRYGTGLTGARDYVVLVLVAVVVGGLGMEVMSPGSISRTISAGPFPMLVASVLGLALLYWVGDRLPGGRRMRLGYFAAGFVVVGLTVLETLSPGSVSTTLGPTISSAIEPAIRIGGLGLVGLAIYQGYQWVQGSPPNDGSGGSGGSSESRGSSASAVNVIVSDDEDNDTEVSN